MFPRTFYPDTMFAALYFPAYGTVAIIGDPLPDAVYTTTRGYLNSRTTENHQASRTTRGHLNDRTTEDA